MDVKDSFDFAIVGGGIAGASLAARLAPRARVLLLERESAPGYHSTGRSAALYSACYGNEPVRALTRAGRAFFDRPPAGFSEHPLLMPRGVLYAGGAKDADAVSEISAWPLAERMDSGEALRRIPILKPEAAEHCAYEPGAFDVDVHSLHQGFLRAAKAAGTQIVCNAELRAAKKTELWQLDTSAGSYRARVLVNAAGAWADTVAAMAGAAPCGLQPLRRTAILVELAPGTSAGSWPALIAADESFYFKPDAGLLLLSPADETPTAPCDAQPEEIDIAVCVDRIETATTLTIRRVVRAWAGLRTFAPDRTPVVGYDDAVSDFFWLAGQGGYGVQTAPALSEVAAALALRERIPAHVTAEGFASDSLSPQRLRTAGASRAA